VSSRSCGGLLEYIGDERLGRFAARRKANTLFSLVFFAQHTIDLAINLRRNVVAHNREDCVCILIRLDVPIYRQGPGVLAGAKGIDPTV
jgi:hypothetical protein